MDITDFIKLAQREPPLPFLIIGGYAVGAHGYTRPTFDVDFLVRKSDRDTWFQRIQSAGLSLHGEANNFAQFNQRDDDGLDLMFVSEETFGKMWPASETRTFDAVDARVPCLDHLLALKLHVLRQGLAHRTSKDANDVEELLRRNKVNLSDPHYEQLFLKYGNRELYETFRRLVRTA